MSDNDDSSASTVDLSIHDRVKLHDYQIRALKKNYDQLSGDIRWAVKIILLAVFGAILAGIIVKNAPNQQTLPQAGNVPRYAPETKWQYGSSQQVQQPSSSSPSSIPSNH